MKKTHFIGVIILTLIISCNRAKTDKQTTGMTMIDKLCENYYEEYLHFFPFEATMQGDNRFNDQLPNDLTDQFRADLKIFCQKYLDELAKIDRSKLSDSDAVNYDVLKENLSLMLESLHFHDEYLPVNQFTCMTLFFPQLGSGAGYQPFKTEKDYDDFLVRIDKFSVWCDTAIVRMKEGIKKGIVNPKTIMEKTLPQLKAMAVTNATQSIFYQPINHFPTQFSESQRDSLKLRYTKAIIEKIGPSYQKLYVFIKDTYIPSCRNTSGLFGTPGGKERYAFAIKYHTGTGLSPDSIYNLGLKEVERIRNEMEMVKTEVGFKGTLKEFFKFTTDDEQFKPFHSAEEVLSYYRVLPERMQPKLKVMFHLVPKTKFEVRQTEKFREASSSAEYLPGSEDGSRPGVFYVPVNNPQEYNKLTMESTFLHEAIPGHHYQISIQQELKNLPKFRKFGGNGSYIEGWALYAESLGKDLGLYTDPYQYFGRLTNEVHRAIRLVVDVGMHAKGWTREEAIAYMKENEAISDAEATSEVERYMAWPGQALSYKIGELKILELRKKAEAIMGKDFRLSNFHDQILDEGSLPLNILEAKIMKWANIKK